MKSLFVFICSLCIVCCDEVGSVNLKNLEKFEIIDNSLQGNSEQNLEILISDSIHVKYYNTGTVMDCTAYAAGDKHGRYVSFFESGNLKTEGQFWFSKRHAEWRFYRFFKNEEKSSDDHRLAKIEHYSNGKLNGWTKFEYHDSNGLLRREDIMDESKDPYEFHTFSYFENGQMKSEYHQKGPILYGVCKEWNEEGVLIRKYNYYTENDSSWTKELFDEESGSLKRIDYLITGKDVVKQEWYENGQMIRDTVY